jgi:hypothetical protein
MTRPTPEQAIEILAEVVAGRGDHNRACVALAVLTDYRKKVRALVASVKARKLTAVAGPEWFAASTRENEAIAALTTLAQHPAPESDVPAGDAGRLDWIEEFANFLGWDDDGNRIVIRAHDGAQGTGETFREAIDAARHAPDADDDEHSTPPTSDTRGMG